MNPGIVNQVVHLGSVLGYDYILTNLLNALVITFVSICLSTVVSKMEMLPNAPVLMILVKLFQTQNMKQKPGFLQ